MEEQETQTEVTQTAPAPAPKASGNAFAIPLAIIFGFALVAGAIFYTNAPEATQVAITNQDDTTETATLPTGEVTAVNENDHILGNPNAPIVIVEYSDFDCPFCKNFHETMNQIMDKYGTGGKVAWVYRHFPLEQLHPSAPHIAAASECVAELGGNDAFWKFADQVFGERAVNQPTNTARLSEFAETAGVDKTAYEACVADGHTRDLVQADFTDGINAGAKGTPYSIVMVGGQEFVINGAQPFEYVDKAIETVITQMENTEAQ